MEQLFNLIKNTWGKLDVVINNAGTCTNYRKQTAEFSGEEFEFLVNTNFISAFEVCKRAYPLLLKSDYPSIINISSSAASRVIRTGLAYSASKAALSHLTRYLAVEWGGNGIRANAIEPWYIKTSLTEPMLNNEIAVNKILERTPLKRIGTPEEVAGLTAFLAMPASSYISGQVISACGAATCLLF